MPSARVRVAVINTHPIQHFAPVWRAVTELGEVDLKIFYLTDWGITPKKDPGFGVTFQWDVDLMGGYSSEFVPVSPAFGRPMKSLGFWEVNNPAIGDALARAWDGRGPEVIVLWGYTHATMWRVLAWARLHGVRVLMHSDSELLHERPLLTRLVKEPALHFLMSQLDGAIPAGDNNARYYQHYGLESASHHWWAFAIDGTRYEAAFKEKAKLRAEVRERLGIGPDEIVFVGVGKFIPRKRMPDLLSALELLPPESRSRARVMLMGDGELRGVIQNQAARLGDRAILTGFLNQSQIPPHLCAADVLVMASDHDPHPLVVAEAGVLGLPAIVSDRVGCVGPHDSVRLGENGWIYPCGDARALSKAMAQCIALGPQLDRFRARARDIALLQDSRHVAKLFTAAAIETAAMPRPSAARRLRRLLTKDTSGARP